MAAKHINEDAKTDEETKLCHVRRSNSAIGKQFCYRRGAEEGGDEDDEAGEGGRVALWPMQHPEHTDIYVEAPLNGFPN